VANTRRILAIEAIAACQALEFLKPLETSAPLLAAYRTVRTRVPPYDTDRPLGPEIEEVAHLIREGTLVDASGAFCGPLE
jgi:histidine ammonia-lyase